MDDDAAADDERLMELETLEAIFPEIQKLQSGKLVSFSIEVPVHPATPVTVTFPAAVNNGAPPAPQAADDNEPRVDSQELAHLPAVVVRVDLPQGYPADKPPVFSVTTDPPWLSPSSARHLEAEGLRMWEDLGHNLVAYDFIDHVQQAADAVFDMIDADATLKIDPLHKIAILDYDIKARKAAFDRETFDCGVCIEPKKGAACHQMLDCAHVFCKACLQDFYNNAIKEGDLAVVRCPFPDCAKKRANAGGASKKRKARTYINPSELLQMGLEQDMVTRYVTLKYKNELESDKNTIYCPRSWCDGAARSKKHRKPEGLELVQASSDEDEDEDEDENAEATENGDGKKKKKATFDMNDLLAICEDCGFAFCSRCLQSWHGEFYHCAPRRDKDEITAEEQASIDYLKLHTSPCPTCAAPVQKTHGCNHMICFRCNSHFCYLCSAWLDPSNPYQHFNIQPNGKVTSCYQRLWELEGGDGDNVGYAFAGGVGGGAAPLPDGDDVILEPEIEEPNNGGRGRNDLNALIGPNGNVLDIVDPELLELRWVRRPADRPPNVDLAPARVAREGPLVLRIGGDPVPRGARNAVPPPAPQAPAPRGRGGHRGARGARGGRGGGGGARQPGARAPNGPNEQQGDPLANIDELDEHQEAWIRNFVRLALLDEEDSDDEDVHHQPPRQ